MSLDPADDKSTLVQVMACCCQEAMHFLIQCWPRSMSPYDITRPQWASLTHWVRVTHICVSKLTIIGLYNGLLPGRRQAIIWTNAGILLIGALGTNVSEILIKICTFSLKKMSLKMSSGKVRPSCVSLNVLITHATKPMPVQLLICKEAPGLNFRAKFFT